MLWSMRSRMVPCSTTSTAMSRIICAKRASVMPSSRRENSRQDRQKRTPPSLQKPVLPSLLIGARAGTEPRWPGVVYTCAAQQGRGVLKRLRGRQFTLCPAQKAMPSHVGMTSPFRLTAQTAPCNLQSLTCTHPQCTHRGSPRSSPTTVPQPLHLAVHPYSGPSPQSTPPTLPLHTQPSLPLHLGKPHPTPDLPAPHPTPVHPPLPAP